MVAVQKLREAREQSEALQAQLATAQVRGGLVETGVTSPAGPLPLDSAHG